MMTMQMNLYDPVPRSNLLPYDGEVKYYGPIMDGQSAQNTLDTLLERIQWKNDEAIMFGRQIITKRKVAWYGNNSYQYTYSGKTRQALPWTPELLHLKSIVENRLKTTFNSCLLNLYHNGEEGMAWHSDDEKSLGLNSTIASLSFGAERKFSLKHKESKWSTSVILEAGSLLVMQGTTQTHWLHCLPKSKKVKSPRVNLTFRTMLES